MVKGTMRCIGTPQELKERYAAGYEISCRLETRDDAHVADLVAFVREAFSSPDVDVAAADAPGERPPCLDAVGDVVPILPQPVRSACRFRESN